MSNCYKCKWAKKAGLMANLHCFAPCWSEAEQIQGYHVTFANTVGCNSFEELRQSKGCE